MQTALKNNFLTALFSILLFFLFLNLAKIGSVFQTFFSVISPFLIGFAIAYLLNGTYTLFQNKVYTYLGKSKHKYIARLKNPLSLLSTYTMFFLIIGILLALIIPQLINSLNTLLENIPNYISSLEQMSGRIFSLIQSQGNFLPQLETWSTNILESINTFLNALFPKVYGMTKNVASSAFHLIIGLVVSVYLLSSREKLKIQIKKLFYAILPERIFEKTISMTQLTDYVFHAFIKGQLLDSLILVLLTLVSMWIFKMPFALLISVIMGVTNVIPIFGPFIGAIPSVLIILMAAPSKAIWFILLIFVLQQLEGNLIAPKIVGDSIGLSGLWVIFAITVGGGLFGIMGMLIGVPLFAVIYKLVTTAVNQKLEIKKHSDEI